MNRSAIYPSGATEWHCPTCERKTIMEIEPASGLIKTTVLNEGDRMTPHFGGGPGVRLRGAAVAPGESGGSPDERPSGPWTH
ncbi:MAG: hypothetical protein ABSF50_19650 [Burkholderiaceae bacterium]